ncbi:MAG: DUF4926 domain-containing protein [Leptolyngbyaceae cyanobacterium RU_5_1]|nr:DUF4926 domain-containing protein [Leptolyngbyaceae cyanobacterium RU_5_1]
MKILDLVTLTQDLPDRALSRGEVGTVVEVLAPGVYEVEFSDDEGQAYAMLALHVNQFTILNSSQNLLHPAKKDLDTY